MASLLQLRSCTAAAAVPFLSNVESGRSLHGSCTACFTPLKAFRCLPLLPRSQRLALLSAKRSHSHHLVVRSAKESRFSRGGEAGKAEGESSSSGEGVKDSSKFRTSASAAVPSGNVEEPESLKDEEEYEEEESWLEEKLGDVYDYAAGAMEAVPGPRVGSSEIPWLVAVPVGYLAVTFVWSLVRLVQKYNTPKAKRRRQIGKNALLCESLDEFFPDRRAAFTVDELSKLERSCGFTRDEVLRKYIRYALNERPFDPELVADLVHLRKLSGLEDKDVAEILNDVSQRVVKAKGPIVMDTSGMTEKGIKRKASVQAIFTKLLYLSQLEDFCSSSVHDELRLKVIFGITDEDAENIKIESLTGLADIDSLEKIMKSKSADPGASDDEAEDSEVDL